MLITQLIAIVLECLYKVMEGLLAMYVCVYVATYGILQ